MWHGNLCIKGETRRTIRDKGSKDDSICELGVKSQIHLLLLFPYSGGVVFSHSVRSDSSQPPGACQTFLSYTISNSLLKLMATESVIEKKFYKNETSKLQKNVSLNHIVYYFFLSVNCLKNSFINLWALTTTIKWL